MIVQRHSNTRRTATDPSQKMVDHTAQEFSSIHLDENVAILDFLIFKATDFVLNELDTEDERIEEKIGLHKIMVDCKGINKSTWRLD